VSFAPRTLLLALALLAGLVAALPAAPARPAKPTREQIARWVQQLGDNDFAAREEASKKLWEAGEAAEAALQEAVKSEDAEVARRARELVNKFKWGIYPDTPPKVVELITAYQTAEPNVKANIIGDLFKSGPPGTKALLKIAAAEPDAALRRRLFLQISDQMRNALPQLLADNNFAALEALLELSLASEVKAGVAHYAAYWLLRGKLDDRIAHFKALAAKGPDARRASEILAYLYRAKGDLVAARQAADKAGRADLVEAFLFEAGDWKGLARLPELTGTTNDIEKLGLRAAYHRLAGNKKGFEEALADLRKQVEGAAGERPLFFAGAKAFLLNARPDEGCKLLAKGSEDKAQQVLFEILVAQLKFGPALELVDKARTANSPDLPALEILQARTLHSLGEKEKALAIFTRYAGQIKEGTEVAWYEDLVDAEYRAGLTDQAFEHAARVLSVSKDPGWAMRLFPKLFPERGETAEALWPIIFQKNAGRVAAAVFELRSLMEGKAGPKEVTGLIEAAERQTKAGDALNAALGLRALAEVARACGQEAQAQVCLEKAGAVKADTPEARAAAADALVRLGDLLADKKDWGRAAERYQQAWELDRSQPLALFLHGWALVKAGQEKEGHKRMEQSHWLPLGDPDARSAFGRALALRGHAAAARHENELLLRLSEPASFYTGEGLRRATAQALARKDYLQAALGQEQSMLRCLRPYINFIQPAAYVGVPAFVHRLRATGLVAAGKLDEARGELALAQACLPGGVELPILLVPELERHGLKKEAADLFDRTLQVYEKLCQDYPRCAWAHNSAAWLSACCRRNLDGALTHATKAVELAPANAGHLDTLAEVYFQRGDKDKALAAQRKVVQMDPKKPYFRKQLKRIEAGDPAAERPSEDDD
jgi:predicted Zn-dependent protease